MNSHWQVLTLHEARWNAMHTHELKLAMEHITYNEERDGKRVEWDGRQKNASTVRPEEALESLFTEGWELLAVTTDSYKYRRFLLRKAVGS